MLSAIAPYMCLTKPDDVPPSRVYDVIVVGSGAAGGWAAKELTEKGLNVLVLEAGPMIDPAKDFYTHRWPYEWKYRGFAHPEIRRRYNPFRDEYNQHLFVDESLHPITTDQDKPYVWVRVRAVGGRSLVWGRVSLRLSDLDFKAASRDGYGEDWPISYKDLEPYYDKVEAFIGVSGTRDGIPHLPDGPYQPPMNLRCSEIAMQKAAAKFGIKAIPTRTAMLTQDLMGRPACHYCGHCTRGCDTGSMFNSIVSTLPAAKATKRLTLLPNAIVRQVLIDKSGLAKGVLYIDRLSKRAYEAYGKVVVLAASTLESTRILLNSANDRYPNGLANSSGVLGHYLMDHTWGTGIDGFMPDLKGGPVINDDGKAAGIYIVRFRNVADKHPKFIRGYGYQGGGRGCPQFPFYAYRVDGFGAEFKKEVKRLYPAPVSLSLFGEVLPRWENYVEIDRNKVDAWGILVLKIHQTYSDNELEMIKDGLDVAEQIFKAAGFQITRVRTEPAPPGTSVHELGTCRMGNDPKRSVLNKFNQAHDVKNLFVVDGGCFVTSACQNPTITIMAITARACDYLVEEFKRGNLWRS